MEQTPAGGLLTTAQASEAIHVDRSWFLRLVQAGEIAPAFRFPGRTGPMLFAPDELERYQAERSA